MSRQVATTVCIYIVDIVFRAISFPAKLIRTIEAELVENEKKKSAFLERGSLPSARNSRLYSRVSYRCYYENSKNTLFC